MNWTLLRIDPLTNQVIARMTVGVSPWGIAADKDSVWVRLKQVANHTKQTIYRLKHELLSEYLRHQLKSPAIQMTFA